MKTKKKNILRLLVALVVVIGVVYASLPYYARQALIHWMPSSMTWKPFTGTRYTTILTTCATGPFQLIITATN